ncbi:MAG: cache domain-containing protein [Gammaproteobacteria bacterium]|nr:cache domain-containing protein [Gammaproteobacteria bacterium]
MFRSRLFLRHFATVSVIIVTISILLYRFTVPLIKSTTYDIERTAGQNLLNVVYDLTHKIYLNIETQRQLVIESRKRELQNVISLAQSFIDTIEADFNAGHIGREEAIGRMLAGLKRFKYGNNDYIWVANYQGVLVSHPDPDLQDADLSGNTDILDMIKLAREQGNGFHRYQWSRLGGSQQRGKISYFQDMPSWGFVVGTGVYLEDIEADVKHYQEVAITELRDALNSTRVGHTGYIFIFDANLNMLMHPNPNIDKTNFDQLLNPMSGYSIGGELIAAADNAQGLYYLWDSPQDPGHYVYEKIAWVRHFKAFDWYIASSVYVDELRSNANALGNRILSVAAVSLIMALVLSYWFIRRLTVPIRRMAETALRVEAGDLTARSNINRKDEIGILSHAFDAMIERLRENIDTLDARISRRTEELNQAYDKERQTEARLAEAQRMQAVGQLSGGLAHDFNNLLTVSIGNLVSARERFSTIPELDEYLEPALRASRRGAEITNRLLAFSRRQPLAPIPVAIDGLVAETILLLGRSLPEHILIKQENAQQNCISDIDPGQLENALVNLAFNARDAMPRGGRLTFRVSVCDAPCGGQFDETPPPGNYVRIDVLDTGSGFTRDALQSAFEPFFTTKGGEAGSGLGLSMVYGFVKQSGGFILLDNRDPVGACISILLPQTQLNELPDASDAAPQAVPQQAWSNRLVLLVEDDQDVRKVVRRDLITLGFAVIEASSADEALPLVESIDELYLVVSDIITPGRHNGRDLAGYATQHKIGLPVLMISGFTEESVTDQVTGSVGFLRKPFDREQLKAAICKLISNGNSSDGVGENHDQ